MPDRIGLHGQAAPGASTVALQPISARANRPPAPVLDLQQLKWINDEFDILDRHEELGQALAAYCRVDSEQPTYARLTALHMRVTALLGVLLEAAPHCGQPADQQAIQRAVEGAHDELTDEKQSFNGGIKVDLQRVNHLCRNTQGADLAATLRALPALKAALDDYHDQLWGASGPGRHMSESAIHEHNRLALNRGAHGALLQQLGQRTRALWHGDANVYTLLGIGRDYRGGPTDAAAFEQAFLQGRLIRTGGKYASPASCADLYRQYGEDLRRDQREGRLPAGVPLAELIALRVYTVNSDELKDAMVAGDTKTMRELAPLIKLVLSGLNHIAESGYGSAVPRTIFRGMKLTSDELLKRGYVTGNKLVIPAFASCTTDTRTQYTNQDIYNVQLEIEQRDATSVDAMSLYRGREDEAVLRPMSCFEVLSVRYAEDSPDPQRPRVRVRLRQIQPDQLFAPARSSAAQLVRGGYIAQPDLDAVRQSGSGMETG